LNMPACPTGMMPPSGILAEFVRGVRFDHHHSLALSRFFDGRPEEEGVPARGRFWINFSFGTTTAPSAMDAMILSSRNVKVSVHSD